MVAVLSSGLYALTAAVCYPLTWFLEYIFIPIEKLIFYYAPVVVGTMTDCLIVKPGIWMLIFWYQRFCRCGGHENMGYVMKREYYRPEELERFPKAVEKGDHS